MSMKKTFNHYLFVVLVGVLISSCSEDNDYLPIKKGEDIVANMTTSLTEPLYTRPYNSVLPRIYDERGILEIQDGYLASSIIVLCPPIDHDIITFTCKHNGTCEGYSCFQILMQGYFDPYIFDGGGYNPGASSWVDYPVVLNSSNGVISLNITRSQPDNIDRESVGNQIYIELKAPSEAVSWETSKESTGSGEGSGSTTIEVLFSCTTCGNAESKMVTKEEYNASDFYTKRYRCNRCGNMSLAPN